MQIPNMIWNRRHNVAAITVSYGGRIWHTRDVDDVVLGYNATGRLTKLVIFDPASTFTDGDTVATALQNLTARLLRTGELTQDELDVLTSALTRAERITELKKTS